MLHAWVCVTGILKDIQLHKHLNQLIKEQMVGDSNSFKIM